MKIKTDTHLTSTQKRNIKVAYDYCIQNNIERCTVNKMTISFNFIDRAGLIIQMITQTIGDKAKPFITYFYYEN